MAACKKPTARISTEIEFGDMPQPIYRVTLKSKSYWAKFKDACASLSPDKFMDEIKKKRSEITDKIDKGGNLTDEDIELLNHFAEAQAFRKTVIS